MDISASDDKRKKDRMDPIRVGVIGLGHWGPNIVRVLQDDPRVIVSGICDRDAKRLSAIVAHAAAKTTDYHDFLNGAIPVDAVVIATPVVTHFELAKTMLSAGLHVLVEKPLAATSEECETLIALAQQIGRVLSVGHVFLFNDGIRYVGDSIASGALGDIEVIHSQRTNLGPIRSDVNAMWDLGTHDISIVNQWLAGSPEWVSATGMKVFANDREDVVNATLVYPGNIFVNVLVSWLHPAKERRIVVVGSERMLVWNDMDSIAPVTVYEKAVDSQKEQPTEGTIAEFNLSIRDGDIHIPKIRLRQPLRTECNEFVDLICNGGQQVSDGRTGLEVVRVLEAIDASIATNGARVDVRRDGTR